MRILRIRIRNTANIRREGLESVAAGLEGQTDKTQVEDIFSSNADPNYIKNKIRLRLQYFAYSDPNTPTLKTNKKN